MGQLTCGAPQQSARRGNIRDGRVGVTRAHAPAYAVQGDVCKGRGGGHSREFADGGLCVRYRRDNCGGKNGTRGWTCRYQALFRAINTTREPRQQLLATVSNRGGIDRTGFSSSPERAYYIIIVVASSSYLCCMCVCVCMGG